MEKYKFVECGEVRRGATSGCVHYAVERCGRGPACIPSVSRFGRDEEKGIRGTVNGKLGGWDFEWSLFQRGDIELGS